MDDLHLVKVEIESGGRLRLEAKDRTGAYVRLNQADEIRDLQPTITLVSGVPHTYSIQNRHFCDIYDVSCVNGTVTESNGILTYTPAYQGYGEIKVNGTILPLMVNADCPATPAIIYPLDGDTTLPNGFEIQTSPYSAPNPLMTHYSTRWQISTDANFVTIVYDVTSTTDLTTMISSGLLEGTPYYIRAMHIGITA